MLRYVWRCVCALAIFGCGGSSTPATTTSTTDGGQGQALFVRDVLAQQLQEEGLCPAFTTAESQASIDSGILDVALRTQYDATFLVGNRLVSSTQGSLADSETATVSGAKVTIFDSAGNQLTSYTRLISATVDSAQPGLPSFEPIEATILDPGTVLANAEVQTLVSMGLGSGGSVRLVSHVQFFGKTLAEEQVQSDDFSFPVDVCYGCLIRFTNDPSAPSPNCVTSGVPATTPPAPCIVGEDLPLDCSACQEDFAACRGAAPDAGM